MSDAISTSPIQVSTSTIQPQQQQLPTPPQEAKQPVDPQKEASQPEAQVSSKFAALARREAKLQAEREALKSERAAIQAERDGLSPLQAQLKAFEQAKAEALKNPMKLLESAGLTLEQLNEFYLNGEQQTPDLKVSEVDRKLEEFRKEQQEERERVANEAKARLEAEHTKLVQNFEKEVLEYIETNSDRYELTKKYAQEGEVLKIIAQHAIDKGEVLPTETAAQLLEDHLEALVSQALETKKFKAKVQPPQPQAEKQQVPKSSTSNRTISSSLTPSSVTSTTISARSDTENLQRAVARYHELARKI